MTIAIALEISNKFVPKMHAFLFAFLLYMFAFLFAFLVVNVCFFGKSRWSP